MALDDVSKITLGMLNNVSLNGKQEDKKQVDEGKQQPVKPQVKHKNPDNIMDALALSGFQNKTILGLNTVDPTKYLSEERIHDIEKSMGLFEQKIQNNLAAIDSELGGLAGELSDSYKLNLAAQMIE